MYLNNALMEEKLASTQNDTNDKCFYICIFSYIAFCLIFARH